MTTRVATRGRHRQARRDHPRRGRGRDRRFELVAVLSSRSDARPTSTAPTWSSMPRRPPCRSTSCAPRSSAASTCSWAPPGGPPSASRSSGRWSQASGTGAVFIPNFSLGSVLGSALAAAAAPFFPSVEIVEAHRETKIDSPSGTAVRTAELIAAARASVGPVESPHVDQRARGQQVASVPIHSLRRPGVVARQETILSGPGESLTIVHDTVEPGARVRPGHPARPRRRTRREGRRRGSRQLHRHRPAPARRTDEPRAARRGRRPRPGRAGHRRVSARIGVAVMAVLLALYIVLVGQRGMAAADQRRADRRRDGRRAVRAAARSRCGRSAASCGSASGPSSLGRRLEAEGGLPDRKSPCVRADGWCARTGMPRSPQFRADVEAHPTSGAPGTASGSRTTRQATGAPRAARRCAARASSLERAERRRPDDRRRCRGRRRDRGGDGVLDRRVA